MNVYLIGVLSALFVFFLVGMLAGRKVRTPTITMWRGGTHPCP